MNKIHVERKGKYYTLNGNIVKPDKFFGMDGFKFVNHVVAWATTGNIAHLEMARSYIENEVLGNGCRRMRSPIELMFWTGPYFNLLPSNPAPYNVQNVANTMDLIDLNVGTGSAFHLTPLLKQVIRTFVNLAREYNIVIEVPWLWTIKGRAGKKTPFHPDPREENGRVSTWNEHFLAANGIGAYLEKLYTEGDEDVEPGGLNIISDFMNEYTAHADIWTDRQLRNVARRWHTRDARSQPINLISQSVGEIRYDPPLESKAGVEGYDGPCVHTPRSGQWKQAGRLMRQKWPEELLDVNESMLAMTQAQRDWWVRLVPKWAGLGTTNMQKWNRMHEIFIQHDIYITFHTFRGMDCYWPRTLQTTVEEIVRGITGSVFTPPPLPPDPKKYIYDREVIKAYKEVLSIYDDRDNIVVMRRPDNEGREFYNTRLEAYYLRDEGNMTIARMRDEMYASPEFLRKNK